MTSFSLPSVYGFKPRSPVRQLSTNYFVTTFSARCRSALTERQQILCLLTQGGLNIGDLDLVASCPLDPEDPPLKNIFESKAFFSGLAWVYHYILIQICAVGFKRRICAAAELDEKKRR